MSEKTSEKFDLFSGCGTYEWHVADNRVVWSAGMLDIFGVERAPTAEEGFTNLVHPDDRMRVEAETSGFLEGGDTYRHEFRILRPDGEMRYIHDRGEIERGPDGRARVLRGLNVDVTEERLEQEARHAARMNDARRIGFYEHDVSRGRSWWSAEMFRLLDYPFSEAVDLEAAIAARVHEDDQDRFQSLKKAVSRRPGPYEIEYRVRLEDGSLRWLRDRGEALGPMNPGTGLVWHVRGKLTDITEMKTAAPATPAGSETFRHVIERAPWGICVIHADFRLVQASDAAARIFPVEEPVGRNFAELLRLIWPEPFASAAIAQFRHTLETGEPYHAPATRERRQDSGLTEVYEWKLEQIQLPDSSPGLVCYFYDLSDRTQKEQALRQSEERLQLAYEASGMGAWDLDLTTGMSVWTPQLYELLGLDPELPASAELFFRHVHADDVQSLRTAFDRSIESGEIFDARFRVHRSDGSLRYLAARGRIARWEAGTPVRMIGVNYDVTERRRMEHKIAENEQALRLVLDNTVAFVGLLTTEGQLLEANATALDAAGLARDDVIGKLFWETPWWSHDPLVAERLREAVATSREGKAVRYDALARMRDDTRMTIDFLLSPIFDAEGRVRRLVASGSDITEREQATERAELLMREINHRSKNILALVQAIARQIWRSDPEDFFDRFSSRLHALAVSQDLLVSGKVTGANLEDLARTQLAHFGELLGNRIHLEGPRLTVGPDAAQSIGMAFHELATNAGKYGALSADTGEVFVAWALDGGSFRLSWTERGGPRVTTPTRSGFGSLVLNTLVRGTLSGEVDVDYDPAGLRWTLTCAEDELMS